MQKELLELVAIGRLITLYGDMLGGAKSIAYKSRSSKPKTIGSIALVFLKQK